MGDLPPVNRQTPVKTLPSCNFVGGHYKGFCRDIDAIRGGRVTRKWPYKAPRINKRRVEKYPHVGHQRASTQLLQLCKCTRMTVSNCSSDPHSYEAPADEVLND